MLLKIITVFSAGNYHYIIEIIVIKNEIWNIIILLLLFEYLKEYKKNLFCWYIIIYYYSEKSDQNGTNYGDYG